MLSKKDLTKGILNALYLEGLSDKEIGSKYGMAGEGVAYRRKKYGIDLGCKDSVTKKAINKLKTTPKEILEVDYYCMTVKNFSEKYGVSKTMWLPYLRSLGIISKEEKRKDSYPDLTLTQKRWVIGSLLGDGGISRDMFYYESHCIAQEEYLRRKAAIYKPYTSQVKPVEKDCIRLKTISHPSFRQFRENFYCDKLSGKLIPVDFIWRHWGDEILAVWYFDDGSIDDVTGDITISNKCPDRHNLDKLVSRINSKYGWSVNRGTQGDLHRLYFPKSCRKDFGDILLRFATPDLYYKIPEESLPTGLKVNIVHDSFYPKLYRASGDTDKKKMEEEIFKYYRKRGFPFSLLTEDRLKYMSKNFLTKDPSESKGVIQHSTSGLTLCEYFFPNMYDCRREGYESPTKLWESDTFLRGLVKNRLKYSERINDSAMRRGIKLSKYCVSNFKPTISLYLYKRYCPSGIVFDYSAGFGSRMLSAMSLGLRYVACEPNSKTRKNLITFGSFLKKEIGGDFQIEACGSETYCEGSCDFSFSSPPYFDFEKYSDEPSQSIKLFPAYEDWIEGYWRSTIRNSYKMLSESGRFGVCLSPYFREDLLEKTYEIALSEGFYFEEEYKCPFKHVLGGSGKYEVVLIFNKRPLNTKKFPKLNLPTSPIPVDIGDQNERKVFRKSYSNEILEGLELYFKDLSAKCGVSRSTYANSGVNGVPVHVIERRFGSWNKFLKACGVEPQYEAQSPYQIVQDYLDRCDKEKEVLSFYKYGKLTETSFCSKMKRLFNKGKKYNHLKPMLFEAVFDECARKSLMAKLVS